MGRGTHPGSSARSGSRSRTAASIWLPDYRARLANTLTGRTVSPAEDPAGGDEFVGIVVNAMSVRVRGDGNDVTHRSTNVKVVANDQQVGIYNDDEFGISFDPLTSYTYTITLERPRLSDGFTLAWANADLTVHEDNGVIEARIVGTVTRDADGTERPLRISAFITAASGFGGITVNGMSVRVRGDSNDVTHRTSDVTVTTDAGSPVEIRNTDNFAFGFTPLTSYRYNIALERPELSDGFTLRWTNRDVTVHEDNSVIEARIVGTVTRDADGTERPLRISAFVSEVVQTDLTLKSVTVSGGSLGPPTADRYADTVKVTDQGGSVTVRAVANDSTATVTYSPSSQRLTFPANSTQNVVTVTKTMTITVAKAGESKTWYVDVTATIAAAADLWEDIVVNGISVTSRSVTRSVTSADVGVLDSNGVVEIFAAPSLHFPFSSISTADSFFFRLSRPAVSDGYTLRWANANLKKASHGTDLVEIWIDGTVTRDSTGADKPLRISAFVGIE